MKGKNQDIKLLLDKELKSPDLSGLHPECLTDAWIGEDRLEFLFSFSVDLKVVVLGLDAYKLFIRWAFIDLSAGPFSWGPVVGGEGVRTEYTLPNVTRTIGAVAGRYDDFYIWCYLSKTTHISVGNGNMV